MIFSSDWVKMVQASDSGVQMHYFKNFKNYSFAEVNLFSNFALLIGKNGSGKSNLIEGVELLASLAEGRPLHEMVDGKSEYGGVFTVRGGIHNCLKFGHDTFSLGFSGYIPFLDRSKKAFDYCITIAVDPFPMIVGESFTIDDRKLFSAEGDAGKRDGFLSVQFDNFARGGKKPQKKFYGDRSIISRYEELVGDNEAGDKDKKLKAVKVVASVKRYLQSSFVFDPIPKAMRDYVRVGQNVLLKDGSNISAVLYSLSLAENSIPIENILSVVRQIPEEPFLEIDFALTSRHDVLFTLKSGDYPIDARLISDGTLRAMAVIVALESIPTGSRVVIEEFDNGLHPSRAEILINAIREIVDRKKLNILLSTHNPASLNSLDAEWLKSVYVCHWDGVQKSSKLSKLLEIPDVDSLLESNGGLGDLVTKSVFEKHLAPRFEENKRQMAMDWLRRLSE